MPDSVLKARWTRVKFAEMAEHIAERVEPIPEDCKRYVGLEHLDSGSLTVRRWGADVTLTGTKLRMRKGDILFAKRNAYLRRVALAPHDGLFSAHGMVLRACPSVVLPEFLPFFMQSDLFMERAKEISVGSLSPTINWKTLAKEEFDLPPLEEQRRIALLLGDLHTALGKNRDLSVMLDRLMRSFLHQTFNGLLADSLVPKLTVEQCGSVLMGRQRAPKYEQGPSMKPYLRVANVYDGFIDVSDVKQMNFSDSEFEQYRLRGGDILLNEGQSRELVGRSAIFRDEVHGACFQNTLIRFRPSDLVTSEYAHSYFRHCLYSGDFIANSKQTTSVAHLGSRRFAKLTMPVPDRELQDQISHVVRAIGKSLAELECRQARLSEIGAQITLSALLPDERTEL